MNRVSTTLGARLYQARADYVARIPCFATHTWIRVLCRRVAKNKEGKMANSNNHHGSVDQASATTAAAVLEAETKNELPADATKAALVLARELTEGPPKDSLLAKIGRYYLAIGEYAKARSLVEEMAHPATRSWLLLDIAEKHLAEKANDEAIEVLSQTQTILSAWDGEADDHNPFRDSSDDPEHLQERLLQLHVAMEMAMGMASTKIPLLSRLAGLLAGAGDLGTAEAVFSRAMDLAKKIDDSSVRCMVYANIARDCCRTNAREFALKALKSVLKMSRKKCEPEVRDAVLQQIARGYVNLDYQDEALGLVRYADCKDNLRTSIAIDAIDADDFEFASRTISAIKTPNYLHHCLVQKSGQWVMNGEYGKALHAMSFNTNAYLRGSTLMSIVEQLIKRDNELTPGDRELLREAVEEVC